VSVHLLVVVELCKDAATENRSDVRLGSRHLAILISIVQAGVQLKACFSDR